MSRPASPKPDSGYRVSVGEVFRFATFLDWMLIILGSIFAVGEGVGAPLMALVFGGMTETLIQTMKNGFAPEVSTDAGLVVQNATTTQTATNFIAPPLTPKELGAVQLTAAQFESQMAQFALLYVAIGVAVYVSSWINITCWQTACERQTYKIRRRFFSSILRQDLTWFDTNRAGELSSKFNDDIERIRDGIG